MRRVEFDTVFDRTQEVVSAWEFYRQLNGVTMIRDVFGKVSLLLEFSQATPELEGLRGVMREKLGGYFGGQLLTHDGNAEFLQWLEKEIKEARQLFENGETNGCEWYLLERPLAKKAWLPPAQKLCASVWPYEEARQGKAPKVISFYSFKGGMGRTTALAGVALCLAQEGKKVAIIDTDVEAPGVATLFFPEDGLHSGVLDYFLDKPIQKESVDIREYLLSVDLSEDMQNIDGELYLMPAGRVDKNYLQKLARIDFQDSRQGYLKSLLQDLLQDLRCAAPGLDYILLDARAGFHDMAGVVVGQIPHGAVLFGNQTKQSWNGMRQVVRAVSGYKNDIFLAMVSSLCLSPAEAGYSAYRKVFLEEAYHIFEDEYYSQEWLPAMHSVGVAHTPIEIPWEGALRSDIRLYSGDEVFDFERVKGLRDLLMGRPYQELATRIQEWFDNAGEENGQ